MARLISWIPVLLTLCGSAEAQWTQWVRAGSLFVPAFSTAYVWIPHAGGTNCNDKAITIADFQSLYPTASGSWCIKFYSDLTSGMSGGHPMQSGGCGNRNSNGDLGVISVWARIPMVDLNLPSGDRPGQIELQLISDITNDFNQSPVLWRNVEIGHFSGAQIVFWYRPCFPAPGPGIHGEWGADGTATICPTQGASGVNTFLYSAAPQLVKTPFGTGSGIGATSTIDAGLITAASGDSISVVLDGAPIGASAWLFIDLVQQFPPIQVLWNGVLLNLYLGGAGFSLGPVNVNGAMHAETGSLPISTYIDDHQLFLQWVFLDAGPSFHGGMSPALGLKIDYSCS